MMATRNGAGQNNKDGLLVVDPDAENLPKQAGRAKAKNGSGPTGIDEQKFYEESGAEFKLKQQQQELGWLGKFFGSSGNSSGSAPTNIAGLVAVICLIALVLTFLIPAAVGSTNSQWLADGQKLLLGLISSAMSFIFGAATKNK